MAANKTFEICEKVMSGELSETSTEVAEISKLIKKSAKSTDGLIELSETVRIVLDEAYNYFDIAPYIVEKRHFNIGDEVKFRTHKNGIRAYWTAPNAYVPKSESYETEFGMNFENLGVRPHCLMSDLKIGKVSSYAALLTEGKEAIQTALRVKIVKIITQTYNATKNKDNYFPTNAFDKETLDKAIRRVRKKTGVNPVLIGDYDLMSQIETFIGFDQTDEKYKELRDKGIIGRYRGCDIIYLPEIIDDVTGKSLIPTNKVFVVGKKIGYEATRGESDVMQSADINDKSWECRYDREVGYVITKPEGLALIEVTA